MRARRYEQAPCGLRINVQTDAEDADTYREVGVAGTATASPRVPMLGANVTCLLPGLSMTTFVVENPYDLPVTVRVGAPTLPWLILSESDRRVLLSRPARINRCWSWRTAPFTTTRTTSRSG